MSEDELRKKIEDIKRGKEERVKEVERKADEFLKRSYIAAGGELGEHIDKNKIAQELGYDHHTLNDVLDYLESKGFIENVAFSSIALTDDAVRYVEKELYTDS